jgi:hypothetical protein
LLSETYTEEKERKRSDFILIPNKTVESHKDAYVIEFKKEANPDKVSSVIDKALW